MPAAPSIKRQALSPDAVRAIAQSCIEDSTNLNDIVRLIDIGENNDGPVAHAAIVSLQFVFSKLTAAGMLDKHKRSTVDGASSAQLAVWLRQNRSRFLESLRRGITRPDPKLQIACWDKHILTIKDASERSNEFQINLMAPLVESLACYRDKLPSALLAKIIDTLNSYDDLRFFFFKIAAKIIRIITDIPEKSVKSDSKKKSHGLKTKNDLAETFSVDAIFSILSKLKPGPSKEGRLNLLCQCSLTGTDGDKSNTMSQPAVYKHAFSDCWLSFMNLPLSTSVYTSILELLHVRIIPHLSEPTLLMDFLVDAYNEGGIISLLALNGLFTLISEHNLDYPDFYAKLYALFDSSVLHQKYRDRFFRLVQLFLSSGYLPAYLVSAFVKRMARLCLFAPPAGIAVVLPLVFNLLKKHPACIKLIHTTEEKLEQVEDPFDFADLNPNTCKAQESCLWELGALKHHVLATISGLAGVFEDSLAKQPYELEDFMGHSFKTMLDNELTSKKRKRLHEEPPATALRANRAWLNDSLWREA